MREKMKKMFNAVSRRAREYTQRLKTMLVNARPSRAQWGKIGTYAALALLLVALGAASSAYRARRTARQATPPIQTAVSAVRVKTPSPTPQPTAEPARWLWPLEGEIAGAYLPETPVWSPTLGQWQTHPALDIAGAPGEAVYACGDGVVADAWHDRLWGNVIVIDHGDGWQSTCAGLNTLNLLTVGERVAAGDVISAVAPSVPCEADLPAHIHFFLTHDGEPVDFEALLAGG